MAKPTRKGRMNAESTTVRVQDWNAINQTPMRRILLLLETCTCVAGGPTCQFNKKVPMAIVSPFWGMAS